MADAFLKNWFRDATQKQQIKTAEIQAKDTVEAFAQPWHAEIVEPNNSNPRNIHRVLEKIVIPVIGGKQIGKASITDTVALVIISLVRTMVPVLYLADKYFACRHCYQLAYQSQRENKGDRGHRGANKIRARLGWAVGIANPPEGKPKGMHWRTYNRLMLKQLRYADDVHRRMIGTLKRLDLKFAELEELLN